MIENNTHHVVSTRHLHRTGLLSKVSRILRTNVFPVFLLTLGVFVWCTLEMVGDVFPIFSLLGNGFRCILAACGGKTRRRAVLVPGKPMRSK